MDINIEKLCERYRADVRDVARMLYPTNARPDNALNRVLEGTANLDSEQLYKLAHFFGCSVADLYADNQTGMRARTIGRMHTFQKGSFNAIYNADTCQLTVYEKNQPVHTEIMAGSVTVTEVFNLINTIVDARD